MICLEYPLPEDIREAEERQKKREGEDEREQIATR